MESATRRGPLNCTRVSTRIICTRPSGEGLYTRVSVYLHQSQRAQPWPVGLRPAPAAGVRETGVNHPLRFNMRVCGGAAAGLPLGHPLDVGAHVGAHLKSRLEQLLAGAVVIHVR